MPPSPENNYTVGPTEKFSRALWNEVVTSIATRLAAREALEATFEALITGGTQAALDVITQNVAPQLESLLESVADLRVQVEEVLGDGNAPNALKLGGNLPEFYLALGNATGTLAYNKVAGIDAAIAAAVAGLVNSAPGALDTLGELAAALGNDPTVVSGLLTAMGNRLRVDAAQALTGPQVSQALDNLGFSTIGKLLKAASTEAAARAAIGVAAHDFVQGLTLSNNITDLVNDIDASPGSAQAGSVYVASPSTMTKRLDAVWTAGHNGGGLDTGVKANSSTYHCWSLRKDSDGSFDWCYSLSPTAPIVPTGYAKVQRLGAVLTNSSGSIRAFVQHGNVFLLSAMVADVIDSTLVNTAKLYTLSVPAGIKVEAHYRAYIQATTGAPGGIAWVLFSSPDESNQAVVAGAPMTLTSGVNYAAGAGELRTITNTSSQIRARGESNFPPITNTSLSTYGWLDYQIPRIGA
ncbi:hypothetical protein [Bosea sp. MMO-172]|uniref:hypothetical protein n=1 Tax=Bosea sp. MMO-172 TaxID=3127885 RepID=UPI003016C6AA